MIRHMAVEE